MARLALNKASLAHQNRQLKSYREFLPSLDMKRRQLIAERAKGRARVKLERQRAADILPRIAEKLPMVADRGIGLEGLVEVAAMGLEEENVMGAHLPVLRDVEFRTRGYALLGKPHWVDVLVERLQQALEIQVRIRIAEQRLALLEQAVRIVTQRVNLFDKVLIPRTRENIRRIRIHLSDEERSAVVRAKLAKRKKQASP